MKNHKVFISDELTNTSICALHETTRQFKEEENLMDKQHNNGQQEGAKEMKNSYLCYDSKSLPQINFYVPIQGMLILITKCSFIGWQYTAYVKLRSLEMEINIFMHFQTRFIGFLNITNMPGRRLWDGLRINMLYMQSHVPMAKSGEWEIMSNCTQQLISFKQRYGF